MYYLQRIREGRPIIVHGDGTSLWGSCHRDDVGAAFANAAGNRHTFGKSYHVTGEEWLTWNQYHQQVAAAMHAPEPQLVHIPTDTLYQVLPADAAWIRENFQHNNIFDNSAAAQDLGFRYTVNWQTGVERVVAWLDARGQISAADEPAFYQRLLNEWPLSVEVLAAKLSG